MKVKVLLVDDEEIFVDALAERLQLRDFKVSVAYSGDKALEIVESSNIDVMVLDVQMPGLTGTETLLRVKQMKPLIQVIMLTGHATVENAIEGMKYGAYDYLMKPTDMNVLAEKVNEAYKLKHMHDERIRAAEVENIISRRGW